MTDYQIMNPQASIPVVANVPHSSDFIPAEYLGDFSLDAEAMAREHAAIVDWFSDELFAPIWEFGGCGLISGFSRLLVDTERFADDAQEVMAARGIGVLYERTTQLELLRMKPAPERREELLRRYYEPYHAQLNSLVADTVARFGRCILLDCHSFPEHSLPYELGQGGQRPDICLGTDPLHSPESLLNGLEEVTARFGWSCARNAPFAGMVVPLQWYGDPRVTGAMLEVNRKLYMDEARTLPTQGVAQVREWVSALMQSLHPQG
ncbi:MAG: N-formylglutamate amidohydrolase [Vulcanimicrobiota bacterium]